MGLRGSMSKEFWHSGLRFSCQQCSDCCRHAPGFVFLSKLDLKKLILFLKLDFSLFYSKYLKQVDIGTGISLSLIEKPNHDCIFWEAGGCTIYPARPIQCNTYPFWESIIENEEKWKAEATDCPGIETGSLKDRSSIEDSLWRRRRNKPIEIPYEMAREGLDEDSILGGSGVNSNTNDT